MPRKSKSPSGTVEFVDKPTTAPEPSILSEPPSVDIPDSTDPTSAPAPPPAPKAKRPYTKKHGAYWDAMSKSRKDMLMPKPKSEPKNEVVVPDAPDESQKKRRPGRPRKSVPVPVPVPAPAPVPAPVPVPVKAKKEKAPPKPLKAKAKPVKKVYTAPSESEEDEGYDDDDETEEEEDEPVIEVVAQKANRRLKTLDKIDRRIKELSNSYSAKGYSVF